MLWLDGGSSDGYDAATVADGVYTSRPLEDRWKLPLSPSGMCARCATEVGDDDAEAPSSLSCGSDERGTVVVMPLDPLDNVGMLLWELAWSSIMWMVVSERNVTSAKMRQCISAWMRSSELTFASAARRSSNGPGRCSAAGDKLPESPSSPEMVSPGKGSPFRGIGGGGRGGRFCGQ